MRTANPSSLALSLFTAAAGCVTPVDEFRDALPSADHLRIDVPEDGGGSGAGVHENALLGERAALYQVTRDISRGINGGVWILLEILEEVAEYPPTTLTQNRAEWGPHTPTLSPLTWRMVVEKLGDDRYEYSLDARPKDGDDGSWVAILSGSSQLVPDTRLSSGVLVAHCDDAHALDPDEFPCTGLVTADWDVTASPARLTVSFRGWTDGAFFSDPIDADYSYRESGDGSGEFSFEATADLEDEGGAAEQIVVKSRWDATGAGRGDAVASGGDVPADVGEVTLSECWDSGFGRTFYQDSIDFAPTEGEEGTCPFSDAQPPEAQ